MTPLFFDFGVAYILNYLEPFGNTLAPKGFVRMNKIVDNGNINKYYMK